MKGFDKLQALGLGRGIGASGTSVVGLRDIAFETNDKCEGFPLFDNKTHLFPSFYMIPVTKEVGTSHMLCQLECMS